MKSNDIFDLIESIAATPSKNEKQALVSKHKGEPQFVRVLVAALNPMITYGIAKVPASEVVSGGIQFTAETWQLLDDLASRKLSGGAARLAVINEMDRLCAKSAELLRRIIQKDLKAGFGDSTVNKAIPKTIPEFPYMRCCLPKDAKLDGFDWKSGVISQEKADGMFANINHEVSGFVSITSRQGSLFPIEKFANLVVSIRERLPEDTQSHGELLIKKDGIVLPREQGNGILNSVLKGGDFEENEVPIYLVWDNIPLSAVVPKGKLEVGYKDRLVFLIKSIAEGDTSDIRLIDTRVVHSMEEAYVHYREMLKKGHEGTVIKNPTAIWRDGTSRDQVKLKLEAECDLIIVGHVPGEGKNEATFGSLVCRTSDNLLEVAVSGFTDARRLDIWANFDDWMGTVITVRSNAIMNPSNDGDMHSLFLPRFVEERRDKSEADSLQRVRDQFNAAVAAA